jgi:hypothetical protein
MAQVKATLHRESFTTALDPAERENRIKAAMYTGVIAIVMGLILWFYSLQMEVPIPLPEAEEVEVLVEPPAGGGGGGGSPNSEVVPIDPEPVTQTPRSVEQTPDEQAVPQVKTPVVPTPTPDPVDNTLEEMKKRREEAKLKAERDKASQGGGGSGTGQGSGTGSGTGPGSGSGSGGGIGSGRGTGIGHSFGSGRSFRAGGTSTDCHEAGKVVLEVQLMPNGKIIFEDVDPGTTGSDCLIRAAKEILRNSSFNSSENPASTGTITFIFKLN